ncbi:MAG: T9SS type A sorting domain-containing protein [Bacteroidetes bacterium]|nr:T9SS type A sorting domain-containing protein [Bacteroidota bacterium]
MTKFIISFAFIILSLSAFSQVSTNKIGAVPNYQIQKQYAQEKTIDVFWLDYSNIENNLNDSTYFEYLWDFNNNYINEVDSSIKYISVGYNKIYNPILDSLYKNDSIYSLQIDSIFVYGGHENNSGTPDTLMIKLIELSALGYPQIDSLPLWSDTIITSTGLSSGNDWKNPTVFKFAPNLFSTSIKRFGVFMEYKGNRNDTMGFLAGFSDKGVCGSLLHSAYKSKYYPNSYGFWTNYHNYGMLPTALGQDLYVDCDGNGTYSINDGQNFVQNLSIGVKLRLEVMNGIDELEAGNIQIGLCQPNPVIGNAIIPFELKNSSQISYKLVDLSGRELISSNEGIVGSGKHQINFNVSNFANGLYFYQIKAGNSVKTGKLIIGK